MSKPTEHKTVQARILAYAEAILLRYGYGGQVGWTLVSREEAEERRGLNRREHRDHKEDLDSDSLCSLRSLRFISPWLLSYSSRTRAGISVPLCPSVWKDGVLIFTHE